MKDNLNIEELFQDKFSSFEGEVSPDAWANIQQGMAAGAAGTTAATTGMSLLMKGVIAGGIVAATVTSVYLFSDPTEQEISPENNLVVNDQVDNSTNNTVIDESVIDENLPENTIDGSNVVVENDGNQIVDEPLNEFEVNNGSENNGALIPTNGGDNSSQPGDSNNGNGGDVTDNNIISDDNNVNHDDGVNAGEPILREPVEKKYISSDPYFEAGNEFAPTTYAFHANSKNAERVEWTFEDGTVLEGEDVKFTFEKPGNYKVDMLVHGDGELIGKTIEIEIKSSSSINTLPNIITPNGDRKNDFFAISTTDIETFYIKITDLKGNVLFEDTDVNFRWYGTDLGGEQMPAGIYIYEFFAKGIDGTEFKKADQITLK